MPIFKCPNCKRIHVIAKGDTDYVCDNATSQIVKSQNVLSTTVHSSNNWNMNEWDTRKDEYEDFTIVDIKTMPSDKNRYAGGTESHNW